VGDGKWIIISTYLFFLNGVVSLKL